jgi:hypothetical protein
MNEMAIQAPGACFVQSDRNPVRGQLLVDFAGFYALRWWSSRQPDSVHSYPIRCRGGVVYFLQPWLGRHLECGFWAHFVLLALRFLILWLHRDGMERIC